MESPDKSSIEVTYGGETYLIQAIGGSKALADWIWHLYSSGGNNGGRIAEIVNSKGFKNSSHNSWGRTFATDIVKTYLGHTLTGQKRTAHKTHEHAAYDPKEGEAESTMEMVEYACTLSSLAPSKRLEMVRRIVQ